MNCGEIHCPKHTFFVRREARGASGGTRRKSKTSPVQSYDTSRLLPYYGDCRSQGTQYQIRNEFFKFCYGSQPQKIQKSTSKNEIEQNHRFSCLKDKRC